MNRLSNLRAIAREYMTTPVGPLIADLDRKVTELRAAADAARAREDRLQYRAERLLNQATAAALDAERADRVARRVSSLIS